MVLTAVEWLTLVAVLGLLVMIVKTLAGREAKTRDERIEKQERRLDSLQQNHDKKFDEVKSCITETRDVVLTAVNDMRVDMAQNYMTKQECRYVQEQHGR